MDLKIVLDILSGGCSADEVGNLIEILGQENVRTYDRLHAKVWLARETAIIGSSNASSNGLGFEGNQAASLVEANILLDDSSVLQDLQAWWAGTIWMGAREITEADLRRAKKLRARHRAIRPLTRHHDLLTGLQTEPLAFQDRNLFVWVWEHGTFAEWVWDELEHAQEQFGAEVDCWQDVENPPPPGSFVIDFNSELHPPAFTGIYRILVDQPIYAAAQGTLLLCLPVDQIEGMPLGHRATWRAAAAAAVLAQDGDAWEVDAFASRFLMPPGAP